VGYGGRWWGGIDKVTAVVGSHTGLRKPGLRFLGQKPETGPLGRGVGNTGGGRWWSGVDMVTVAVGLHVGLRKPGLRVLGQKPEIRAIVDRFRSAFGLQEVEENSVVS
jgi:hypothetical protein